MRVALADDSALFREGLALLLRTAGALVTVEGRSGDELLARIAADPPDVVLLDLRMPPTFTDEGLVTAEEIHRQHPAVGVLVLSTYADTPYAMRLLSSRSRGVGYLLKDRVDSVDALRDALDRVARGESVIDPEIVTRLVSSQRLVHELAELSPREHEVLRLMAEGRSNAGIAAELFLGTRTVESHVAAILSKLDIREATDVNRRVLAVLTWLRTSNSHRPAQA